MYAFLFLAIPAVFIWFSFRHSKYEIKSLLPAAIIGFITGLVICCAKEFFIFSNYRAGAEPVSYALHILISETLVPCLIPMAVFFIFSKDDWNFKTDMTFTLLMTTFLSFLPYIVISGGHKHSAFMIFIRPVLTVSFIILTSLAVKDFRTGIEQKAKNRLISGIITILAALFIPCIIQALWFFKIIPVLTVIFSILFTAFSIFRAILNLKKAE